MYSGYYFLVVAAVAVYFFRFLPKPPKIAVNAMQFPAFSAMNGTINFKFFQYMTVTNPNRDEPTTAPCSSSTPGSLWACSFPSERLAATAARKCPLSLMSNSIPSILPPSQR
ncbi:Late embryogenesis abundant protein domain-containing protein [Forsythia ovata]|uniref:Late embryogenesis abundant protein domain-containing protein n=1 Tax=Forsythia ovata TaxID=205694 RepID=A0ABD1QBT0_9LAMI